MAAAVLYGGGPGLAGAGIGLAAGAFSTAVLWLGVRQMSAASQSGGTNAAGIAVGLLAVAAKVPVLLFAAVQARRVGDAAFDCFLGGFMLVYFAVVAGAAASTPKDDFPTPHGPEPG